MKISVSKGYNKWRPHPWHGLEVGPDPPAVVHAFIEITPYDTIKYEVDKVSGYLMIDRPQLTSSLPAFNYGFIPRTYCWTRVAGLSGMASEGDCDPLDVCVISERPINRAEIILPARVVGVIKTIDQGSVDDKIVAVLEHDAYWGDVEDVSELPGAMIDRLRHYLLSYKNMPAQPPQVSLEGVGGAESARAVIAAAMEDYNQEFLNK